MAEKIIDNKMNKNLDQKKKGEIRHSLLMYCKLDTMAMAVVWKELQIQVAKA